MAIALAEQFLSGIDDGPVFFLTDNVEALFVVAAVVAAAATNMRMTAVVVSVLGDVVGTAGCVRNAIVTGDASRPIDCSYLIYFSHWTPLCACSSHMGCQASPRFSTIC